ncbi:MAG TPA: ParA family protein [bacterium]|jgi:chromosome partitioning protein|nr:ParA family protein [bacterium]
MRKIAISLSKGGVGKTTTAVNLSAGLARTGYRVLLIDTDTQGQASRALGVASEAGLAELISGEASPAEAIQEVRERLYLLAGGRNLAGLKRTIDRKDFGGENTLAEGLEMLDSSYDFAILDTAPGWDSLTVNVLFYADEILAPVSMEILTVSGLLYFQQSIQAIQKYRPQLEIKYVLPTFMDGRVKKSEEILAQLQSVFHEKLCSPIRYSVRLSEAPGFGQTIYEYAPASSGVEDYQALVERISKDG